MKTGYNGPVRSLIGCCGAIDYWCPGCGSIYLKAEQTGDIRCISCGRVFRPIMFGPLPENDHLYDLYDSEKLVTSHADRGELSEGLWYVAMDSEHNDNTFSEISRRFHGREPSREEVMDIVTAMVSAFDLRGYPDMLDLGECAVLPDGILLKVVRVRNILPKRVRT